MYIAADKLAYSRNLVYQTMLFEWITVGACTSNIVKLIWIQLLWIQIKLQSGNGL